MNLQEDGDQDSSLAISFAKLLNSAKVKDKMTQFGLDSNKL